MLTMSLMPTSLCLQTKSDPTANPSLVEDEEDRGGKVDAYNIKDGLSELESIYRICLQWMRIERGFFLKKLNQKKKLLNFKRVL
jgi:hypothetical protein